MEYIEFSLREAVAHGIARPFHIDGKDNPADVLSKHTSSRTWYELMRPLIFWRINEEPIHRSRREGSISMMSFLSDGLVYYYMRHVCFLYDMCVFVCIY